MATKSYTPEDEQVYRNSRKFTAWDEDVHVLIVNAIGPEDDPSDAVIEEMADALVQGLNFFDKTVKHGSREIRRELMLGRVDLTDMKDLAVTYKRKSA